MIRPADRLRQSAAAMRDLITAAADEIDRLERHEAPRPLTDEAIKELIAEYPSNRLMLARAIERAHGIEHPEPP